MLCSAIHTRKSTEEGLEQKFNMLGAHRDAAEAFIRSQRSERWAARPQRYDDCVMVYEVARLTRSLLDFARGMELLDKHGVTFVSVTQQFNTISSLVRLTLNILLSFARIERGNDRRAHQAQDVGGTA